MNLACSSWCSSTRYGAIGVHFSLLRQAKIKQSRPDSQTEGKQAIVNDVDTALRLNLDFLTQSSKLMFVHVDFWQSNLFRS